MTLVPAAGYGFLLASGITADFRFGVDVNGGINFETEFAGFAGASASKLRILGYPMVLDAVHADSDLVGIASLGVQAQTPRELNAVLIPAKGYCPQTANGTCRTGFNMERDGRITFDPAAAGSYVIRNSFVPNPSDIGEEISVGIYVRGVPVSEDTPQGNLSFVARSELLGGAMLDSHGRTELRTSGLPEGEHDVLVEYLGDSDFRSSSATVRHRVE
jgi:Bacterial Ig-like domain (group 3)